MQVTVCQPCDCVWVGAADPESGLSLDAWAGRQAGAWVLGSNDALCHDTQKVGPLNKSENISYFKCTIHSATYGKYYIN